MLVIPPSGFCSPGRLGRLIVCSNLSTHELLKFCKAEMLKICVLDVSVLILFYLNFDLGLQDTYSTREKRVKA